MLIQQLNNVKKAKERKIFAILMLVSCICHFDSQVGGVLLSSLKIKASNNGLYIIKEAAKPKPDTTSAASGQGIRYMHCKVKYKQAN